MFKNSNFTKILPVILMCFVMSSCDLAENYTKADRSANLEMQDFRDGLAEREAEIDPDFFDEKSSIPALQPYVASASESMKAMPIVSISVNQTVPIRDVLFELAEQANYDIELDPNIRGSIIFTARERPFDQVIERISEMAGLRYRFKDDVLRIEVDNQFNKTYKIDYLSYIRSNSGNIRNDVAVVSGEGADTGSTFTAQTSSEADFWGELETNLAQMLGVIETNNLRTSSDPRITAVSSNPDIQTVSPSGESGDQAGAAQAPQATLTVNSLPVDSDVGANAQNQAPIVSSFAINKQAGLVSVYATERQHKEVQEYLVLLERAATSQVLIEAKILEVTLNDEFSTGIDWRAIDMFGGEFAVGYLSENFDSLVNTFSSPVAPSSTTVANNSNFVLGYAGSDAQAVIQAISGFGTVRALASPRMTVLNNQSAVLNVATNRVFFDIDINTTQAENTSQINVQSDIRNVPEGILVNVQPSINLQNNTVSLAVRPTITRVVGSVSDPAVQFVAAQAQVEGIQSFVPELNVQEIDSVIRVRSGQPVVMGGLLQDRATSSREGVPVLGELPVLGAAFRQQNDLIQKTELVIFLKATILGAPSDSVHNTDRDVYRQFSKDRRPFKL